jgi:hypothetical protein
MHSLSSESAGLDIGFDVGVILVISAIGILHLNGPLRTTNLSGSSVYLVAHISHTGSPIPITANTIAIGQDAAEVFDASILINENRTRTIAAAKTTIIHISIFE